MVHKRIKKAGLAGWPLVFFLWSIQGALAFFWLWFLPTDTTSAVAFGFSAARLVLLSLALFITFGSIVLFIQSRKSQIGQDWLNVNRRPLVWDLVYLSCIAIALLSPIVILVLYSLPDQPAYSSYASRLSPFAFWGMMSGLEAAIILASRRQGDTRALFQAIKPELRITISVLSFLVILGTIVLITRVGITPDRRVGAPAIPLWEWQILLILLIVAIFAFFPHIHANMKDKWIVLGIYIFALVFWLSQPINTAFTATPPRAPNFEIYPFSDPQVYAESAQAALAGHGFMWPDIPARPFYIALLTWFHLLGNQDYNNVILLQTLVLGFFPAALYLIGAKIGGRPLGLSVALFAIFRDINANISVPFASNVSYSKLFLSELPTALLISLVTLLSMRWLRQTDRPAWIPLLIGGLLGTATLIRTQSITLVAIIVFLAFVVIPNRKQWLMGSTVLVIGLTLILTPWLIRNYIATGGLVLDNPFTQTMTMTRRWSGSVDNVLLPRLPAENDAEYSGRMMRMALDHFRENPRFILQTAGNHFINNEIASLLAFPLRDAIVSPAEVLFPQHQFWKTTIRASQLPLFGFYVFLLCLGVAAAYRHHGLVGLLPLGFGLLYNFWTALFFTSGGRFLVPLDWSVYLYQMFGLLILGGLILAFTQGARQTVSAWLLKPFDDRPATPESDARSRRRFLLSLIMVLFLGLFLPVTEFIFPQKYPPLPQENIAQEIGLRPEEGEIALYGRAVYPRYYAAGEGEPGTAKLGYEPNEQARLVFFLIGPQSGLVVFEREEAPEFFPHTADVFMVGTYTSGYYSPRVVKVIEDAGSELYRNR
ncbi:MAG TPA: hypothetical protein VJ821_19520 [Anaerolineales bacterium]|nr:hypothetical protein [Anaerolineales bacterium]